MRFLDIKKFWEAKLGGSSSKNSESIGPSSPSKSILGEERKKKNDFSIKKRSISNRALLDTHSKETPTRTRANGIASTTSFQVKRRTSHDSQQAAFNDFRAEAKARTFRDFASCNRDRSFSTENRTLKNCSPVSVDFPCDAISIVENQIGDELSNEKIILSEKENLNTNEDVMQQLVSKSDRSSIELVSNEKSINGLFQKNALAPLTKSSSTSAPPSVFNSPHKKTDTSNNLRYLRSNVKFNDLQNFWLMKEKKFYNRSIEERRCLVCGCSLNNYCYEQENALYCEEDYWKMFGHSCEICKGIITGPIMIAGLHRFHPECFECYFCKLCISDGERYSLLIFKMKLKHEVEEENIRLFCQGCYQKFFNSDSSIHTIDKDSCKCTAIQVVDFFPLISSPLYQDKDGNKQGYSEGFGLRTKCMPCCLPSESGNQTISQQLVSSIDQVENCALKVGDVILQVNGLAVHSNALDLVDRLFDHDSGNPLQLTIQRQLILSKSMCFDIGLCSTNDEHLDEKRASNSDTGAKQNTNNCPVISNQPRQTFVDVENTPVPLNSIVTSTTENNQCIPFSLSSQNAFCCQMSLDQPRVLHTNEANLTEQHEIANNLPQSNNSTFSLLDSNLETLTSPGDTTRLKVLESAPESESCHSICNRTESFSAEPTDKNMNNESISNHEIPSPVHDSEIIAAPLIINQRDFPLNSTLPVLNEAELDIPKGSDISDEGNSFTFKSETLSSTETLTNHCEGVFDHSLTVGSRSKRHAVKRRSLASTKQKGDAESSSEVNPSTAMPARSNSLRSNKPVVNLRRSSPRARTQTPQFVVSLFQQDYDSCTGLDLSRSESMRIQGSRVIGCPRVFRPCDLIHGEVLGQGFFGKAIKVTHRDTGEVMVLKVLNSIDEDREKSFLKEVKVMRNLEHRNVIHFIGVLYKDRRLNIITEFIENGTLKDVVTNMENDLPWKRRVFIARDITAGMSYLHSKNLIHRDLNSGNCFVKKDGTVVVADFGLARVHLKNASLGRKKRYTVVGNPFWMAPEMLYGKVYDETVDVFSFGIVLCEIIGRVDADPNLLPRNRDFGLAVLAFYEKFCQNCPAFYFAIAVHASSLDPENRPSFKLLEEWFAMLAFREELSCLPDPPNLRDIILSVYSKYKLPLPNDLFAAPFETSVETVTSVS